MDEQAVIVAPETEKLKARAQRFVLQLPLRYRVSTENTWRRGETINVSSSGVLFRGDWLAAVKAQVELNLMMPRVNSEGAAEVICRGIVVRAMAASSDESRHALAVKILQYHLVRP
jgi:hypothetical protein